MKEILSDKFPKKDIQVDLDDKKSDMTNFFPHSSTLKKAHYDGALIIVLDSAIKNRIASYSIHHAKEVVKIDHHLSTEAYGDLNFVNKKASSTCEIVVQIANELE
ncbi:MAG: hypothetical protein DRP42_05285 [Tenericutes bacterium]|nr:MAG: hypothetical protein DRP42_05285 [Mycoplasmatota bacterium]